MSSSIAIPKRRKRLPSDLSSAARSASSSSASSASSYSPSLPSSSPVSEQASSPTMAKQEITQRRRPSLLSESISRSEYTVVNVGGPDAPRLITCVRKSQGFEWNHDIFLPSYIDRDFPGFEHKHEPIIDIILTDEEAAALLPQ